MVYRKNVMAVLVLILVGSVVFFGCMKKNRDDDPLINPNLDAELDDGGDDGGGDDTGQSGPGILTINPVSVNIPLNETMTFTAAGGIPPYVFTFVDGATNASYSIPTDTWTHTNGCPTLTGTGVFTAGPGVGSNQIRVTDSDASVSDSTVNLIAPGPTSYRIVSTNLTPYVAAITVPTSTLVYFVVENGTSPDSFNVTDNSGGSPQGFMLGSRTGCWETGTSGADDGSVFDLLQVYDSSDPINVASLKIYVSTTALSITPTVVVVPALQSATLTASPGGVLQLGSLAWSLSTNASNGSVIPASAATATYQAGSTTNGIFGAKDIIECQDEFPFVPQVAQAQANVPGLSVYPERAVVAPGNQVTLNALGGSGTYNWSNQSPTLVNIAPSFGSCVVTALTSEGEAVVNISDGTTGGSINVSIVVCGAVTTHSFTAPGSYYPSNGTMGSSNFYPVDMAVDDFDGNGVPDVAMPMSSSSLNPIPFGDSMGNQLSVLLGGASKGSFQQAAVNYQLSTGSNAGPWGATTGDYNGDGNRDVAVACSGHVLVMLGDGSGAFPNSATYPYITVNVGGGFVCTDIVTYDFDRSNGQDLAVCDGAGGKVAVLLSQGAANAFTLHTTLDVGDPIGTDSLLPACFGIAVANFDSDGGGMIPIPNTGNGPNGVGYVDIAVSDYYYDRIVVFQGTGLTTWNASGTPYSVDPGTAAPSVMMQKPVGLAAGDLDNDGDLDLITANNHHYWQQSTTTTVEMGISVMTNNSSGGTLSFSIAREYGPDRGLFPDYFACYFWGVVSHDFDNDGRDDVAALSRGIRLDSQTSDSLRTSQVCIWQAQADGSLNGWGRSGTGNDNYATSYLLGGGTTVWDFYAAAISPIDFAGHTRNNGGAPLTDLIVASGSPFTWNNYYGKMTLLMNNCD